MASIQPYMFEPVRDDGDASDDSSDTSSGADISDPVPFPHVNRLTSRDWCKCGNCGVMPTVLECVCCRELSGGETCIVFDADFQTVCLHRAVLATAMRARADVRSELTRQQPSNDCTSFIPRLEPCYFAQSACASKTFHWSAVRVCLGAVCKQNDGSRVIYDYKLHKLHKPGPRALRHQAYRQFTYWMHGKLGRYNRKVIPSCVVLKIRKEFPSASGEYKGFREADL